MVFVTYFDNAYAPKAIAMIRSLRRWNPGARVVVLSCDEFVHEYLMQAGVDVDYVTLGELESDFPDLRKVRVTRPWVQYLWTLTPHLMLNELMWHDTELAYVDADLFFYQSMYGLYEETKGKDVSVIPHRWSPRHAARLSGNGKYNVAWVKVANTDVGEEFLREWARMCLGRCDASTCGDQGHLDDLAERFPLYEVQHLGANLAPWSQEQYTYRIDNGTIFVEDDPLLFYHFHEFLHSDRGDVLRRTGYGLHPFVAEHVYPPYERMIQEVCSEFG